MRNRIFVSYRKDNSAAVAGRIADSLKHHFGEQGVFFDASDLRVASAWSTAIDAALTETAVAIVVIGPKWLEASTSDGQRRLDLPNDVVRREIEVALRDAVSIIPLTVDGASFPTAADLPSALRGLAEIKGDKVRRDQLSHSTFDDDVDRLMRNVSRVIAAQRGTTHDAWRRLQPKRRTSRLADAARTLLTSASIPPTITRKLAPDPFLRQDPYRDIADYGREAPIAQYLPYVEIKHWCDEIVAGIFVRDGDELTPYLVSRAKDVAVFNCGGEWHCTASGVAEIEPDRPDREPYFYADTMLKELDEEVGLLEHDLDFLEPVAFCREMTRAGKPQMFFLGVTSFNRTALRSKLTAARKRTKEKGWVVENTAMPLWRRPSEISDEDALKLYHDKGFTIEAAACLHYYFKCRSMT